VTLAALAAFGCACLVLGVQLGRWSVFLLTSWSQQLRERADRRRRREVPGAHPRVQVEHAGQYVQHDRTRPYVGQLEPPGSFARVR
jgi:hypothetical protein